ncbi:MAG: hypothetical protein KDB61_12915, partial [Planctomycetes bacterium]|nr:hypothetical protein [Planctomycetota bacterium]
DQDRLERELFAGLARRFQQAQKDPAGLAQDYLEALALGPTMVRIECASEVLTGTLSGLDFDRGIGVQLTEGSLRWLPLEHVRSLVALEAGQG